jgi:hypothetical protein
MILFFRNIPASTEPFELEDFIEPAMKVWLYFKRGRILKTEMLAVHDTVANSVEFHALVYVDSEKTGTRIIKKLNGKHFKTKPLEIREYINRCWQNDRRINREVSVTILEKRQKDRRRIRLEKLEHALSYYDDLRPKFDTCI